MEPLKIFDVDQHLCDLHICDWQKELPAHLQHKAPRNLVVDGVERLCIEDKLFPKHAGKGIGHPLGSKAGGNVSLEKRLRWMKQAGIDGAILTPGNLGMAVHAISDRELKHRVCERYREWQLEQISQAGEHCTAGLLVDPFSLPSLTTLQDKRISCLYMRPTNAQHLHLYDEPVLSVFRLAAEADLPVLLHAGTGYHQNSPIADQYDNYFYTHLFSHTTDIQIGLAEMFGHGIFQMFPSLRVIFVEAGVSWVPGFVHRLQYHLKHMGHLVPGKGQDVLEILHERCMFSVFHEDADGLGELLTRNPWLKTALGSDYPHWDTMNVKHILKDVDGPLKREVAYENAAQFFTRINRFAAASPSSPA